MFCESYEPLKALCQIWFLVISPLFELFWFFNFRIIYIIKEYICERNFMSYESILREIQTFKVLVLVLKLVPFESDNVL
jgi:hypothetical protein